VISLLAVLAGGGARDIALVTWALIAAACLIDLGLSWSKRKEVSLAPPPECFVGETEALSLNVTPLPQRLKGQINWPDGLSGPAEFEIAEHAQIPCRANRRGTWHLGKLHLNWPSRLRLFEFIPTLDLDTSIKVVPNIRLVQSGAITSMVMSTLYGVKENRAVGEGSEFHQLRDFVAGMDIKSIDWKRSAKHHTLVARELRAERNHHVIIALDNGYLMREEIDGLPKIDHAVTAALATAWAAALGGDLVGFFAYDSKPSIFVSPEPGRTAFAHLRRRTADLDYVSVETNHTLALTELNARTPKRSLIIIFSDFVDTTTAELLLENISVLSKRHVVVFVILRDPAFEEMVETAPENMDEVAQLVSAGQSLAERRLVLERLAALGVTIVDTKPGTVTAALISTYLDIKAREVI